MTYLSTGMRRAVATCTSPEVFFGQSSNAQPAYSSQAYAAANNDPPGLAMDSLKLSSPVMQPATLSQSPGALEQEHPESQQAQHGSYAESR